MAKPRSPSPTLPLSRRVEVLHAPPTGKAASAEHAELAGTLQSGMSHTPSTEDEDEQEVLRHGLVERALRAMPPDRRKAFLKGAAI